ncbi:hypothetical protein ILYODFUR_021257 [Ilyodon furcidens]|uniref:Uncharacterized protein n=1 Tax=Ilyodon furcidens TaxID=33524 RepID=A0ABV0V7S4_9TELE
MNGKGREGCRWQPTRKGQKLHTQMGTMDTNPEILMSRVVSNLKQRQGCVFIITHTTKRVAVKGYPILVSPFPLLPPPLFLSCMHISHSHEITHTVGPGQCTHARTHARTHTQTHTHTHNFATPVEHRCQAEKERQMYSFTFYCAWIEC